MGKSQRPLNVLCIGEEFTELHAFADKGYRIDVITDTCSPCFPLAWKDYDLILGPRCHRMDDAHRKYLSLAIAEARRVRYPKGD